MNTMLMLVRREYWEHRALWIAPLVVAAAILLVTAVGAYHRGSVDISIDLDNDTSQTQQLDAKERAELQALGQLPMEKKQTLYLVTLLSLSGLQLLVLGIVVFFYLLDALYSERKDRSILFWKSLPVSDRATVLSKALVALVVTPLLVIAISAVTQLAFSGIWAVKFGGSLLGNMMPAWDAGVWLRVQGLTLVAFVIGVLWYAPIAAYLLLMSAWARRNVFLWAVLPPVTLAAGERILTGNDYIGQFLADRFLGVLGLFATDVQYRSARGGDAGAAAVQPLDLALNAIDPGAFLQSPGLWLGLAAAAVLLFVAIRIRRYRDDT